jgi:hypothetical protein
MTIADKTSDTMAPVPRVTIAKQAMWFLANADAAGIVLGARVPIILTSRADSTRTRMASCAVVALYTHSRRASVKVAG